MKLDFTNFMYALSYALDAAEYEVTGATAEHGKRVAWISWLCASKCGLSDEQMVDLVSCAILHDNAMAEYLREELDYELEGVEKTHADILKTYGDKSVHAYIGEQNIRKLPFRGNIENAILYHHENADGSGPFGKKAEETNLLAQIIHIADNVDMAVDLPHMSEGEFEELRGFIRRDTGTLYSQLIADLFLANVTWQELEKMQQEGPLSILQQHVPVIEVEYTDEEMTRIAGFFADIVDFKSSFTKDHSVGVAQKAQKMAEHYGFDHDKMIRFAFAGAMHDIGKMVVGNEILEKPDKLNQQEFSRMKDHAAETYKILSTIKGLEDVTEWASNHHEKLDGTGYSRRLNAEQQTFEDRLMACIDIYQALTESRPYKDGLSHKRSIGIMTEMAGEGKIDAGIVKDLDQVFGQGKEEEEDNLEAKLTTKRWKCSVCGYIYEGDTPPASCPICDTDADEFTLMD